MGYEGLMKIPRRCFAEVAWLYQNDSRKATIISEPDMGFGRKIVEKWFCLTSVGSYGVLLGTGRKSPSASLRSTVSLQRTTRGSLRL
jgi:hypothetical protein